MTRLLAAMLVVQAAIEGQGIALGWNHLTSRPVESGLLVRVTDHVLTTGNFFSVAWPRDRPLSGPARSVRDWLCAQR